MDSLISTKSQSWLSWFLRGILILGFLALVSRLFELQIIKGNYFRSLSEENRIKRISITAPRGKILARGGEEITGKKFAHVLGYLGEVDAEEVGTIDPNCLEKGSRQLGEMVGRSGLNEKYNCILKGVDGEELVEVNTHGEKIRTLGVRKPVAGTDIHTTIDYDFQNKAVEAMGDKKGAVIISDPKGEILTLYSSPSFDPLRASDYLKDPDLPFFNRAIGGTYHPGSVFKPLVAIASLSEGKINKDFTFDDMGQIEIKTLYGKFVYTNWFFTQYGRVEGRINLVRALARSTDTFFYTIGEMVGPENIALWANKFGLGVKSGIDIPGEVAGLVPTPEWKKEAKGENWFLGNTYHLSIGQGDIALTPIEVNTMVSTIANEGELCTPKILDSGEWNCKSVDVKKGNLDLIKEGMKGACSAGGTGFTFFDFKPEVACKTGTAEVGVDGVTHAWFTLFAPVEDPEIVMTVLVEKGGEGSRVAGPIARTLMDYWNLKNNP